MGRPQTTAARLVAAVARPAAPGCPGRLQPGSPEVETLGGLSVIQPLGRGISKSVRRLSAVGAQRSRARRKPARTTSSSSETSGGHDRATGCRHRRLPHRAAEKERPARRRLECSAAQAASVLARSTPLGRLGFKEASRQGTLDLHGTGRTTSRQVPMRRAGVMPHCGFSRSGRYGKACSTAMPPPRIVSVRRRASAPSVREVTTLS